MTVTVVATELTHSPLALHSSTTELGLLGPEAHRQPDDQVQPHHKAPRVQQTHCGRQPHAHHIASASDSLSPCSTSASSRSPPSARHHVWLGQLGHGELRNVGVPASSEGFWPTLRGQPAALCSKQTPGWCLSSAVPPIPPDHHPSKLCAL